MWVCGVANPLLWGFVAFVVNFVPILGPMAGVVLFLMASVLERFLGLYVSINSFVRLVARSTRREGVLKRWPPRSGDKTLL